MYLIQITEENQNFIAKHFNDGVVPQVEKNATFYLIPDNYGPHQIVDAEKYLEYTRGTGYNGPDPKSILLEHV